MKRLLSIILFLPLLQQKEELKLQTKGVYSFKPLSELWHYKFIDPLVATYYMSPSGNNGNAGSIGSPWHDFDVLTGAGLAAGDIVYVRGGTYRCSKSAATGTRFSFSGANGSAGNLIKIWNYPGESPVFNFDDVTVTDGAVLGLAISSCSYIHMKGIRFTGLLQCPTCGTGANAGYGNAVWVFHVSSTTNSIFEIIQVDNSSMYGFTDASGNSNNLYLNCDAFNLTDQYTGPPNGPYGGSNGFNTGQNGNNATGVILRGCRAWWCSDDGFDSFRATGTNGTETFENCWSFWNGYFTGTFDHAIGGTGAGGDGGGFKLGPNPSATGSVLRTLTNCLAFQNYNHGFDQNTGNYKAIVYNCTAYGNRRLGFNFNDNSNAHTIKNNAAWYNGIPVGYPEMSITAETTQSNNTWNGGVTVSDADFVSVSSTGMDGARQSDGSLPVLTFLHLASGSDLIDAGTNVSLPFNNAAPDMGAFETGGSTPPVLNTIKVVRRPKRIE